MPGPVVTIARQHGSGGDEVAAQLAERLGVPLIDQEIISRAAQQAGVSEQALRASQRHAPLLSRMLESLGKYGTAGAEIGPSEGFSSVNMLTTSADFRNLLADVLRDIASAGPAVVIGHAAQVTLRDAPGTLHVFVHAPTDFRAARLARELGMPAAKALTEVEASDRERVRFFQTAYHVNWYDLRLYDVVVDTQIVGVRGAAEMIADLAKRSAGVVREPAAATRSQPAILRESTEGATVSMNGDSLAIRPMTPSDAGGLLSLFRSLAPEDLLFLRRDVTNELVVDAWARDVADGKIVTLLAETATGEVVGEASVRQSDVPWTRNVGEVRVVIAPTVRAHGVGRALLQEIMAAARAAGMDKLTAEMTVEQGSARRLFEGMGFVEEGRFRNYARDQQGRPHDLLMMTFTAQENDE